jgi:hypothetical protein
LGTPCAVTGGGVFNLRSDFLVHGEDEWISLVVEAVGGKDGDVRDLKIARIPM